MLLGHKLLKAFQKWKVPKIHILQKLEKNWINVNKTLYSITFSLYSLVKWFIFKESRYVTLIFIKGSATLSTSLHQKQNRAFQKFFKFYFEKKKIIIMIHYNKIDLIRLSIHTHWLLKNINLNLRNNFFLLYVQVLWFNVKTFLKLTDS